MKMLTVELIVCWDDKTWTNEIFMDVDPNKVGGKAFEEYCRDKYLDQFHKLLKASGGVIKTTPIHVGVYHVQEKEDV